MPTTTTRELPFRSREETYKNVRGTNPGPETGRAVGDMVGLSTQRKGMDTF